MKSYTFTTFSVASLDDFFVQFGAMVNGEVGYFGRCLNSFADCLHGSFGLQNPSQIIFPNSSYLFEVLGPRCLIHYCESCIDEDNPYITDTGRNYLDTKIVEAKNGSATMFGEILNVIRRVHSDSMFKKKYLIELQ